MRMTQLEHHAVCALIRHSEYLRDAYRQWQQADCQNDADELDELWQAMRDLIAELDDCERALSDSRGSLNKFFPIWAR